MLLGETPRDVSTSLGTGLQNIRQVSCDAITVAQGFLERIAQGFLVPHLEQVIQIALPYSQEWSMYPPTPAQRAPLRAHRLPRAPASGTASGLPVRAPLQAVACPGSSRKTVCGARPWS